MQTHPEPAAREAPVNRLLAARARLESLRRDAIPRTLAAAHRLRVLVRRRKLDSLGDVLRSQRDAIDRLDFELVVPVGLRAGAPQGQHARFRRRVAAVARGSQAAWTSVQGILQDCAASAPLEGQALFEFTRCVRSLEREVAEAAQLAAGALADLRREHAASRGEFGRHGYAALAAKAAAVAGELERVQAASTRARLVRDHAVTLGDVREALLVILRRQAVGLGPPLLTNLAGVIAPRVADTPDTLHRAQRTAAELAHSIDAALTLLAAWQTCCRQFAAGADSFERAAALGGS